MSLKTRTITGLTFGAVMISLTAYSQLSCAILYITIGFLCIIELSKHILLNDSSITINQIRRVLIIIFGGSPALLYLLFLQEWIDIIPSVKIFCIGIFLIFIFELFGQSSRPFENIAYFLLSIFYLGLPFSLVVDISYNSAFEEKGNILLLFILFMVWASDVFAYLLGSVIGKNKLFPRISPKKTWEGTISGFFGAILVSVICFYIAIFNYDLLFWIGLASVSSVFAILGDLVESMFKRSINIKDSGTILPGHGGFLDRFDAFIFVIPFVWIYIDLFA